VGGHVVGPFAGVAIEAWVFLHQLGKKRFKIKTHIRIGIFLYRQAGRGMADKHRHLTRGDAGLPDPGLNHIGDFNQALTIGANFKGGLVL